MHNSLRFGLLAGAAFGALALANPAAALPAGLTCIGTCGELGPNGVVTAPPEGGPDYLFISTSDSPVGGPTGPASLNLGSERNGSLLTTTNGFALAAGDTLRFFFNYVTTDGEDFTDYAWAALDNLATPALNDVFLFTARTTPTGNTVPGFGLPGLAPGVTLNPASTPVIAGAPAWSPLGSFTGRCFGAGCGYTGWIEMTYTTPTGADGAYSLRFGVANWDDRRFDSGLAIAVVELGGNPWPPFPIPAPAGLALFGAGLLGLAALRRR